MNKVKVMAVFGTRPEAIKMAPVIKELQSNDSKFETKVLVTAQHREMLDQILDTFGIRPDYDLNIMKKEQSLSFLTASILRKIDPVLKKEQPDIVLVHGDTTTSFVASLAAYYNNLKVAHVEAGLRTYNKYEPFPEELNRQMTDIISDIHFAPTSGCAENLINEGKEKSSIYVTGNTVIDALKYTVDDTYQHEVLEKIDPEKKLLLLTVHRKENQGEPLKSIFSAVLKLIEDNTDLEVVFPVHPNPIVQTSAIEMLGNKERISLIPPLDVIDFHNFMKKSHLILTDSGGIQEEAPALGTPVLVLRNHTERPEGIKLGTVRMVGTVENEIVEQVQRLLQDNAAYEEMKKEVSPYGDGCSSKRIVQALEYEFSLRDEKPQEFLEKS